MSPTLVRRLKIGIGLGHLRYPTAGTSAVGIPSAPSLSLGDTLRTSQSMTCVLMEEASGDILAVFQSYQKEQLMFRYHAECRSATLFRELS